MPTLSLPIVQIFPSVLKSCGWDFQYLWSLPVRIHTIHSDGELLCPTACKDQQHGLKRLQFVQASGFILTVCQWSQFIDSMEWHFYVGKFLCHNQKDQHMSKGKWGERNVVIVNVGKIDVTTWFSLTHCINSTLPLSVSAHNHKKKTTFHSTFACFFFLPFSCPPLLMSWK